MSLTRRQFIKYSCLTAGAAVGTVSIIQSFQEEHLERFVDVKTQYLTSEHKVVLTALAPVLLGEIRWNIWLAEFSIGSFLQDFDKALALLSKKIRNELIELLDLLFFRVGKLILAQLWSSWQSATRHSLNKILLGWRESFITLLNQGYLGLMKLVMSVFYSQSKSWPSCGYPGPPF